MSVIGGENMRIVASVVTAVLINLVIVSGGVCGDKGAALQKAIENYDLKAINEEIKKKVDLNSKLPSEKLPLRAAVEGGSLEIVKALISGGAKPTRKDDDGLSAFDAAVATRHFHLLPVLFTTGEQFDTNTLRNGLAPLMVAASAGNASAIELLLKKGAKIDLESSELRTALSYAIEGRHLPAIRALLDGKSDPKKQGRNGATPLHEGVLTGDTDVISMLIAGGAKVAARDAEGVTPLGLAVKTGDAKLVSLLISKGASVKNDKSVPLAVTSDTSKEIVALLEKNGFKKAT